jgi:hypothetical protein
MVFARYSIGWWPSKLIVVLTLIILLGYSIIDAVVAGQILSAVSPDGGLSVIVGIVIVAVMAWAVATFGYRIFHFYERYAWISQMVAICILAGVSGPKFDLYSNPSSGLPQRTVIGNRLSFFSLCYASAVTYACAGAGESILCPSVICNERPDDSCGLLRLLSGKHIKVESLCRHSYWSCDIFHTNVHPRHRAGFWNCLQCFMVRRLQCLARSSGSGSSTTTGFLWLLHFRCAGARTYRQPSGSNLCSRT